MIWAVQLRKAAVYTKEPLPEPPHHEPPTPTPDKTLKQQPYKPWQPVEDDLLTKLWEHEPHYSMFEITKRIQEVHPARTKFAVKCRANELMRAKKIKPRWVKHVTKKPEPETKTEQPPEAPQQIKVNPEQPKSTALPDPRLEMIADINNVLKELIDPLREDIKQLKERLTDLEMDKLNKTKIQLEHVEYETSELKRQFGKHKHAESTGEALVPL